MIDLIVNSVTVWDEPDGFRITTAYNLTSCKNKTYRVSPSSGKEFGFEGPESTKKERHDVSRVFLFWVPPPRCAGPWVSPPKGGSTLPISTPNNEMLNSVA